MPLYKTLEINTSTIVYIWKINETEEELSKNINLSKYSSDRLVRMKSELHRKGFLSIRHLMALAGYEDADMYYDEIGKPHLKDGKKISITHSNHFTGIIISTKTAVGIDIEKQREKILRIAHKFTPIKEYRTIANTSALIRKLTIVWGCKESLYKIYEQEGLSFLKDIIVNDFDMTDGKTTGEIIYNRQHTYYKINFLEFENFTCVYAIKE
ncbi:4'-phosphopantetheinyl transferase superfamily protein [Maribacter vaceletii]|uniref:4'-phosphopantetheinyl transferase superfamily protein n=1 Tax=Maribacter vaceletii TaxID=1206816 RepID=A0A495EDV4_9FLAO|nr:4'-phosphopantetheinyl transferase family protein [Maribacter vaceletii]RKR15075.1 4'-phosphopantetheinyl transferase superfamily protein [Maribacter vaceletii]